jgi:hypothetical protein
VTVGKLLCRGIWNDTLLASAAQQANRDNVIITNEKRKEKKGMIESKQKK